MRDMGGISENQLKAESLESCSSISALESARRTMDPHLWTCEVAYNYHRQLGWLKNCKHINLTQFEMIMFESLVASWQNKTSFSFRLPINALLALPSHLTISVHALTLK